MAQSSFISVTFYIFVISPNDGRNISHIWQRNGCQNIYIVVLVWWL